MDFYPTDLRNYDWEACNWQTHEATWVASRNALCTMGRVTVNKAESDYEYPQSAPKTYNGTLQTLVTLGSTEHGTMVYSLSKNGEYTETIPTVKNAGEYKVWFKVIGDENHTDTQPQSIDTWMYKAPLGVTANDCAITYGEAPTNGGVRYEGFVGNDTEAVLDGELTYTYDYEQFGDVGTYAVTPGGLESGNYIPHYISGTLTVNPKYIEVVAEEAVKTYGDADPKFQYWVDGLVNEDTLSGALSREKGEDAGSYTLTLGTLNGGKNYSISRFYDASLTIQPKAVTSADVGVTTPSMPYTGHPQTVKIAVPAGAMYDVLEGSMTATDVGMYEFIIQFKGNYSGTFTQGFQITPVAPKFTAPVANKLTYNGKDQALVTAGTTADGKLVYSLTENGEYSTTIPSGKDAGHYTVWYYVQGDANHADSAKASVPVDIGRTELTIAAKDNSITYGDAPANAAVTYTGFVNGETDAVLGGELAYSYNYAQFDNAGTYKITPSGLTSGNYEITFVPGVLTVEKNLITVKADAITKTYGEADPALTYKTEGLINGDKLTGQLKRTAGENVGTYDITAGTLANSNYTIDFTGAKLTINAKPITAEDVKLNGSLTYNGKEQTQKVTVTEGITYEVTGDKGTKAGEYELTVKGTGNYTGSVNVKWSIAKADVTVTADNKVIYVGQALPKLTYTVSGFVNGEKLTKEPTMTTGADKNKAGSYTITVADADAGDNYEISYALGTLTVMDKNTEVEIKVQKTALTQVPDGLKNTKFNTVEAIKEEMIYRIVAASTGFSKENMEHYDVTLQFSLDGGKTWILATEENFPTEGITLTLPYPDGTNPRDYDFVVSHMFTVTSQRLGTTAGEVELPKAEETEKGLRVTLKGLSPVTVAARYHDHTGGTATCADKAFCDICGSAYGELDSTNHAGGTEVKNAKEATCGADGYTGDTHCKGCGEIVAKGTAIKATGKHTYGDWRVVKEATKTAKGEKQRTCSVCGHAESEEIPMLSSVPATGDDANIMLYGTVLAASLALLLLTAKKRRQKTA